MPLRWLVPLALVLLAPAWCTAQSAKTKERDQQYAAEVQPLLKKYCFDCHGDGSSEGDFNLDSFTSVQKLLEGRKRALKVVQRLHNADMPPKDAEARPTKEEYAKMASFLDTALNDIDCSGPRTAGHVTLRRLTRYEYRNTVRDLLGVDYKLAETFPADEVGYGFDNIGDVLSLPPLLLEKYLSAAEEITREIIKTEPPKPAVVRDTRGSRLLGKDGQGRGRDGVVQLASNGEVYADIVFPQDGEYILRATAFGDQAGDEPPKMQLKLDDQELRVFDVKNDATRAEFEHKLKVAKGSRKVALAFINDFYDPNAADENRRDRNLSISRLEVVGPVKHGLENLPASHTRLITVTPDDKRSWEEAAKTVLAPLAKRAFRRPVSDAELKRLVDISLLAKGQGDNFETGIQLAVQAILVSPHFLFKVEQGPDAKAGVEAARALTDHEIAVRLSYFLWSTMPDDALTALADKNELRKPEVLEQQVRRMIADDRSKALVENFGTQWLTLRNLDSINFNTRRFRNFNPQLRDAMKKETELFVTAVMKEDLSLLRLLDADFTFVNEQLAGHYGIADVKGSEFRRVSLAGTPRGGLLTQASILAVTSNPGRTSPVKRGKWILENLLNEPPPPPPPNVPELPERRFMEATETLRERMKKHREDPTCNSCHQVMDSLGFALENYDAIGQFRDKEGRFDIDASGELPSGEKFAGAAELRQLLLRTKRKEFLACISEKMLTYALGRGLEYYDQCEVDRLVAELEKNDHRFSTLVVEVVRSYPFLHQGVKRSE